LPPIAELSASIYLQAVYGKEPKKYFEFWDDERTLLTERNKEGFRAIDAGPLTLGYRMSNSRTGFNLTRHLIYPKGAYVLHMIRMMLWNRQTGDQNFKALMQDFVQTYANRSATTEDFKAMVEKHMTQEMDLDGNHKMDWFFNEYVYGTALPKYDFQSSFDTGPEGDVVLSFKLTQSGVNDNFKMLVPLYLQLADGRTMSFGRARIIGNNSVEHKVPIKGLKERPLGALANYNFDVLAEK
jgi:aminopeptidase N